jgi:NTP pyrophosphatase (non-canonical NTP hydrolase)
MKPIDAATTLGELQDYVRQFATERGFDDESVEQKFVLLVEEVGELAKAIRTTAGVKFADDTRRTTLKEELADVQLLLLNIANTLAIDMSRALEEKEVKNRKRLWK